MPFDTSVFGVPEQTEEQEREVVTCTACYSEMDADGCDYITNDDGDIYCQDCYDERYTTCHDCGHEVRIGSYYHRTDADGYDYCDDCYCERYTYCADCGDEVDRDDALYDEDTDEMLCQSCYDARELNATQMVIGSYHSHTKGLRKFGNSRYFFGCELEIQTPSGGGSADNELASYLASQFDEGLWVFERDGTVAGFEAITEPMSLPFIRRHADTFRSAFAELANRGCRSHDATCSCGLHVHVSNEAFGTLASEQELNIAKTILLVERLWGDVVKVARRESSWCAPLRMTDANEIERYVRRNKGYSSNHGTAVNIGNPYTVEFRIFKGTLNADTFLASVEFVNCLVKAASRLSLRSIQNATNLRDVLKSGNAGTLPATLDAYMTSRGL